MKLNERYFDYCALSFQSGQGRPYLDYVGHDSDGNCGRFAPFHGDGWVCYLKSMLGTEIHNDWLPSDK